MKGKQYTLTDRLPFGKYRGMTIQEVLKRDADYIRWCKKAIDGFVVIDEADSSIKAGEAMFYSAGLEVLQSNPWGRKCFEHARRFAEDVFVVVEKRSRRKRSNSQLEIEFA